MSMDSFNGFIAILILAFGLYTLYAYLIMKKTGKISTVLLLGKNQTEKQCKDKAAYLAKAMPVVLVLGIVTTLYGVIDVLNYFVLPIGMIDLIASVVFFAALVWFMVVTVKLKKIYF